MDLRKTIEISVMVGAAFLEVGGDAMIRKGLRGGGVALVMLGFAVLGSYGVILTMLELDFTRLMGAYVGLFVLTSFLFGRLVFGESINAQTWVGLVIVVLGSMIIQFAQSPSG